MPDGSSSAAPVMRPGPSSAKNCRTRHRRAIASVSGRPSGARGGGRSGVIAVAPESTSARMSGMDRSAVSNRDQLRAIAHRAFADVDVLVKPGSAVDGHARANTTSVYTAAEIFPMLPEKLSTDLTSLGQDQARLAVVVEMVVGADGTVAASDVYRALVRNRAKLAYDSVAAWLDGTGPAPPRLAAVPGLDEQLRIQDRVAQAMKALRHQRGALSLET